MDASPDFWTWLVDSWNKLREGLRDNITAELIAALVVGVAAVFRKGLISATRWLIAATKRFFNRNPHPAVLPTSAKHEVLIKVETQPPGQPSQPVLPQLVNETTGQVSSHSRDIPRLPAISFVPRRDKEGHDILEQLKEKLTPGNDRLVALWGSGGVGKTRLATEAVHALSGDFAGRVVWVSADGRPDFALSTLLDATAAQLDRTDLRQLAPDPKREAVCALIAEAPTLLVLDNFETIAPDEQARCREFLARDTTCPTLITTRGFIESNLVENVSIDAMSPDEAQKFLEQLVAQAPDPACFDAPIRERIISTAAFIPLVIEWVVQQILLIQEPQDVLDRLAHGDSNAARRVFDSSFNLPQVGDDGRAALLALSLFTSAASRAALAEVAGFGKDTDRLNRALAPLGSLRFLRTAEGGRRVLIEGLTRDLAQSHLSKDSRAGEFRQRFVAHFLAYAEAHAQPTPEDLEALEAERDNVLGAIDTAFKAEDWDRLMRIRHALENFLELRGYWDEAIQRGDQAMTAAQAANNEGRVAQFAANMARIRTRRGEYDAAKLEYQQALTAFRKLGSEKNVAACLHNLARIAQERGAIEEARRLYNDSLEISKKRGDHSSMATSLHNLAVIAQDQGKLDEARELYYENLETITKLDDQSAIAATLHQIGKLAQDQGNIKEARRRYGDSLEIKKRLGGQIGIAITLHNLGILEATEGNNDEAARLYREALSIFEKLGSPHAEITRRKLKAVEGESS